MAKNGVVLIGCFKYIENNKIKHAAMTENIDSG